MATIVSSDPLATQLDEVKEKSRQAIRSDVLVREQGHNERQAAALEKDGVELAQPFSQAELCSVAQP